jgi:effector-binding domain-containing protein
MSYEVHIKQVPPETIVTERCHTSLPQLADVMQFTFGKLFTSIESPGGPRGAPFAIYHDEQFRPEDIDVELGVPVSSDTPASATARRELPGGPVAYAVHVGPYSTIGAAYEALYTWVARHGHHRMGPPREIYLVGPGEGSGPESYRTEIDVPID